MSENDLRNSIGNYSDYLKKKAITNRNNNKHYDYTKCFNKAIKLINDGKQSEGVALLKELYLIKKDPDVLKIINENIAYC